MPNRLILNGLHIGQEQGEVCALYPELNQEGWDPEFAVFQQSSGLRIVMRNKRVHSVLDGTELLVDDRRFLFEGMSLASVLKTLGDPHKKRVGEYHSGQFDDEDRPVAHPDSPGIVLLENKVYEHEIQVGFFRGPEVCAISIRRLSVPPNRDSG